MSLGNKPSTTRNCLSCWTCTSHSLLSELCLRIPLIPFQTFHCTTPGTTALITQDTICKGVNDVPMWDARDTSLWPRPSSECQNLKTGHPKIPLMSDRTCNHGLCWIHENREGREQAFLAWGVGRKEDEELGKGESPIYLPSVLLFLPLPQSAITRLELPEGKGCWQSVGRWGL